MTTCPNCNHPNPQGAINCEACFTPLPVLNSITPDIQCPQCHGMILATAKFCGHCGFNLLASSTPNPISPDDIVFEITENAMPNTDPNLSNELSNPIPNEPSGIDFHNLELPLNQPSEVPTSPSLVEPTVTESSNAKTQLQQFSATLIHVQTNLKIEVPTHLPVVHIGKPNNVIPPDIDVSGFPDSDIVSRIHADIRIEGGNFYFEDTGSSNGTYINNLPLPVGDRHKLKAGDRIALGKGDKVSFIFQLT